MSHHVNSSHHRSALGAALEWYLDQELEEMIGDVPVDRTRLQMALSQMVPAMNIAQGFSEPPQASLADEIKAAPPAGAAKRQAFLGKSDAREEAVRLAKEASTLEDLRAAIESFDGVAIKKTATNMVFCDGNPQAEVMLVGEAPGADDDRQGKPFVGVSGQLLDRILKCIDLDRMAEDPKKAVYMSNILNWRPPGNRTPSPAEIEVSLPFIERHIALVKPKILILCGGVSAKALLARGESISRLRKSWHDYKPLTQELGIDGQEIQAIATYHPTYLLRTPAQKKAVWMDMLSVREKLDS